MSITFNNGLTNYKGTPGIYAYSTAAGQTVNLNSLPIGTWVYDIDTNKLIYWNGITYQQINSGGGGGSQNIQQVLTVGNIATDISQEFHGTISPTIIATVDQSGLTCQDTNTGTQSLFSIVGSAVNDLTNLIGYSYQSTTTTYIDLTTGKSFNINTYSSEKNDQTFLYPEDDGVIALQDPPFLGSLTTNVSPLITKECYYQVDVANIVVTLDITKWTERKRVAFCANEKFDFAAAPGSTIKGQTNVPLTGGLVYVVMLNSIFFISHI